MKFDDPNGFPIPNGGLYSLVTLQIADTNLRKTFTPEFPSRVITADLSNNKDLMEFPNFFSGESKVRLIVVRPIASSHETKCTATNISLILMED